MRSSPYNSRLQEPPFWQPMGFMSGTPASITGKVADCSSRTILPSLTYTRYGQLLG
jgi:hypothetical protein